MTPRSDGARGLPVRARILAATLFVVALALCAIVLVTGRTLFARIEANAAAELEHETEKLRASAFDAATAGVGGVREMLTAHLAGSVPEQYETFFTVIDGRADRRSHAEPLARLDLDDRFVAEVARAETPRSGRADTAAGPVAYAAIPVRIAGDPADGVFVIVEFLGPARAEAWSTILTMSAAALFALVLAGAAGWLVAGRALTPVREVQRAASEIGAGDLDRRIGVVGSDDVAQLAVSFNRMLDRVQAAFDGQRRFLDDVGHELRTPITVVRGHLDVMGEDPADRAQTLRLVDDELRRTSRLVDDLILLARSERPDFLVRTPVDVADLVVETLAKATALGDRAWSLDAVPEGTVVADGQRLAQALLQLAANAVDHTGPGQTIAIGGATAAGRLTLWVRDDGRGIPEAEQPHLFERFARGSAPRRAAGTGLGLAIVARIAEAHGGAVRLVSAPGEGATFTLDLPLTAEEGGR